MLKVHKEGEAQRSHNEVHHPSHYNTGRFEVIEVLEDWGFGEDYYLGTIIAYLARSPHKGNQLTDLKKARWYLDRKIRLLEREAQNGAALEKD